MCVGFEVSVCMFMCTVLTDCLYVYVHGVDRGEGFVDVDSLKRHRANLNRFQFGDRYA